MIYEFKGPDGDVIEREYPISNAPPVGKVIRVNGKKYTRLPSTLARPLVQRDCHFVSHSLPRGYKHHKGEFNEKGQPLFSSWREQRDTLARANDKEADAQLIYE